MECKSEAKVSLIDKKMGFLSINSMVEVSRDKEGFKGAWFIAKILEGKRNGKILVEYQRLISEISPSNQPLIESVEISSIRPLPPPSAADQRYEPLDIVEAFHRNGWWKGVVSKVEVLEDQRRRYKVVFENPPEKFDFCSENLRFHLVRNGGRWVRPPKEKESPNEVGCEEQSERVDNIAEHFELVVSAESSSVAQDHTEEKSSSCKMSDEVVETSPQKLPNTTNCVGEPHNVCEGTKIKMVFEGCARKEAEFSTTTDMENEGDREGHVQEDGELVKNEEMPFVKTSSLWQYVDSLEVFQTLPQKPHFTPLFEYTETVREGYAIGHMLNFANVVEKTLELQVEKPRGVFDSYLDALAEHKMFGFDVKAVVERIHQLLSIKTRKEQLENRSKSIHSKIAECDGGKAKMEEEINAIDKMIRELEKRRAVKLSEKAKKDYENNLLQIDADHISAEISNAKLDFENQVAAPW